MNELNMNDVEALEGRALAWDDTFGKIEVADAAAAAEMAKVCAENSRGGILLATEESLRAYEAQWRSNRDREAFGAGSTLETDTSIVEQRVNDAIAAAESLKSATEQYGKGTTNYLLAENLDEQRHARAVGELAGLTRTQVNDIYAALRDDDDKSNALIRLIEQSTLTNTLERLRLKDEPTTDAAALLKLRAAVQARRKVRVPEWLFEARERIGKIRTTRFAFLMGHLKSGRGIASRPSKVA